MNTPSPKLDWREFDRPLTSPRADLIINRVALAAVYAAAGFGLWYFWNIRPQWISAALMTTYSVVTAFLVRRSLSRPAV